MQTLVERAGSYDAAIIAAFSDPGLQAARAAVAAPVAGLAESAMLEAAAIAERFASVTLGAAFEPLLWRLAETYGVGDRLARIRILPWRVSEVGAAPDRYLAAFRDACIETVAEDGAGAIVVGGGPLSGIAERIADRVADRVGVPVLDGVACAVRRAERLAAGKDSG
jgi:Asp/Glu/hydantoin racemase